MTTTIEVFGRAKVVIEGEEREGKVHVLAENGQVAQITHADGQRRSVVNDDDHAQAVVMHGGWSKTVRPSDIDPISMRRGLTVTNKRGNEVLQVLYTRPRTPIR